MFGFLFQVSQQKIKKNLQAANELYSAQRYAEAAKKYRQILKADKAHFAAKANLAVCYFELEKFELALPLFQEVIKVDSLNPWWYNYLSQICQKTERFTSALDYAWQAVELSDGAREQHLNMAYTIYEISDEKGAAFVDSVLKKWYQKYADNGIVKQSYKSFYSDKNFICSDIEYIENLFDVFAPDFDNVLRGLEYRSPLEISLYLSDFFCNRKEDKIQILDLGCGSGLCGKHIKEVLPKSEIIGIDISSKMLEEAAAKNVYSELIKADIPEGLKQLKSEAEVVVAADVLTYFGKLDNLFRQIADSLKSNGVLVFTVSINKCNKNDWFLQPCSRFVHSEKYIDKLLQKSGFFIIKSEEKILRKEGGRDVVGRLFLCSKK